MTPTISPGVKKRLTAEAFNYGFKMMTQISTRFQPTGDDEFMRLTKSYYTIKYDNFKTISDYITHIKTLEERILATNVILTPDKQTILYFAMSLPDHLQYLTKIWAVIPDMTAAKAITMLLEEERKGEKPKEQEVGYMMAAVARNGSGGRPPCKTCGKNHGGVCWDERPDLVPEWLQEKRGTKRKCTESSTAAVAFSF